MCYWITDKGGTVQSNIPNRVVTETNQLFYNKGKLYLVPRNTVTDNYTIPFGINKSKWDARPSHLHDIGCKYHQVIIVDLPLEIVYKYYLDIVDCKVKCLDIPPEYLKIVDVTFDECNDLLKDAMNSISSIPKYIVKAYRMGVNFNINWVFTGKEPIDKSIIYTNKLIT